MCCDVSSVNECKWGSCATRDLHIFKSQVAQLPLETWWSSGRYFSTFRFPKDMHICREPGRWKWQNWKLKEHLQWGRSQKNEVCGLRFVPGGFSCTNSPTSCTWRKVVDWYKRNIVSLPKHHIRISRVFATLMRPIVRNTKCDPLVFTTPVGATHCFLQHLQFYQNPTD